MTADNEIQNLTTNNLHDFTIGDLKELKTLYNEAIQSKKDKFTFKDKIVDTSYCMYVIEYLSSHFKRRKF
jgi:hypothetical protein